MTRILVAWFNVKLNNVTPFFHGVDRFRQPVKPRVFRETREKARNSMRRPTVRKVLKLDVRKSISAVHMIKLNVKLHDENKSQRDFIVLYWHWLKGKNTNDDISIVEFQFDLCLKDVLAISHSRVEFKTCRLQWALFFMEDFEEKISDVFFDFRPCQLV